MSRHARASLRTLGMVLRTLRKERQLSQDRLANLTGIDRAYLGGIERAERHPTWEIIARLLTMLDVGWGEFGHALDRAAQQGGRTERPARR